MNQYSILFIDLDTHKEFVEVAYIDDQYDANPVRYGRISSAKGSITKLAKQFQSKCLSVSTTCGESLQISINVLSLSHLSATNEVKSKR